MSRKKNIGKILFFKIILGGSLVFYKSFLMRRVKFIYKILYIYISLYKDKNGISNALLLQ